MTILLGLGPCRNSVPENNSSQERAPWLTLFPMLSLSTSFSSPVNPRRADTAIVHNTPHDVDPSADIKILALYTLKDV